jgi:pilus assembly protein FimV
VPSNTRNISPLHADGRPEPTGFRGFARLHAVAAAVVLCIGLAQMGDAQALALGRIVVQSALGEPLRAEIDVPDINTEEAASLRVGLASSEAFRAAGMDFNPALSSLQISLQRRANGSAYLRLSSARPVNEPFVDIIVEANWASGRIVRDYTLLLDPPHMRAAAPVATLPAAVSAPTEPPAQAPAAPQSNPVPPPALAIPAQPAAPVTAAAARTPAAPTTTPAPDAKPAPATEAPNTQLVVRAGETAGRIAAGNRAPNVSLDQMLVALLRANPNAFISGNVNLIKAGSVLNLPSEANANSISPQEARQVLVAQSRDFNEYRRRLAETVPTASVDAADRQTAGRIQTEVQEQKPAAPAQDKLTLSKGTASATAAEAKIAQERQAREASTRVAELSKNIEDLSKLGSSSATVATKPAATPAPAPTQAATPTPATVPGIAVPAAPALTVPRAPVTLPAPTPAPAAEGSATVPPASTAAATDAAPASDAASAAAPAAPVTPPAMPAVAPPVAKPAPVQAPPEEPSLLDSLLDNPLVLPAAGGLLALLAGFAFIRLRQRKQNAGVDSSFMESRLQPDSFFGNSGGQRIDTADSNLSDSSLVYSPSQLDAAGDVDPVAEADVYLAYGRDQKAEEILRDAMRSTPQRVAIHSKLLGIYAKRHDLKAFEAVASDVYDLTMGQGPEWDQACALGRELDPTNSLYEPGGRRTTKASLAPTPKSAAPQPASKPASGSVAAPAASAGPSTISGPISLDLDLDFSMDEPVPPQKPAPAPAPLTATSTLRMDAPSAPAPAPVPPLSFDMDFSLDTPPSGLPSAKPSPAPVSAPAQSHDLPELELDDMPQFELPSKKQNPPPVAAPAAPISAFDANADMLSFDLGDLSPSLPDSNAPPAAAAPSKPGEENPLETKLALAEEFRSIGFMEGARSLAEEVLAEATGPLKTKASKFLADLS